MNKIAIERRFFNLAPGEAFDEAWLTEREGAAAPAGRSNILRFEQELAKLPQHTFTLRHYFINGLYVREIHIPAGVALVGYIHTQDCITTVSKGAILISEGGCAVTIEAPYTTTCLAGSKKAGYALRDTVWSDAYLNPTDERDIGKLEKLLTADTHDEYLARLEHRK